MDISQIFRTFVSVKRQVNDITEVLAGLSSQLESMRKTIDDQHATICQINRTSQRQLKEIKDLKKVIKGNDRTIDLFFQSFILCHLGPIS